MLINYLKFIWNCSRDKRDEAKSNMPLRKLGIRTHLQCAKRFMKMVDMKISELKGALFFLSIFFMPYCSSFAEKLTVGEINATDINFSVYHSYKHKQLLIALTHKNEKTFECLPNRYVFYDYGHEDYFEIEAGNLLLNSDFTRFIATHVYTLAESNGKINVEQKKQITRLITKLNISAKTLENGKTVSTRSETACWQQPELFDSHGSRIAQYPYLAANLCKKVWCGDFFWHSSEVVRFWIQIYPDKLHWVDLNTTTNKIAFLKNQAIFSLKYRPQHNAPRDNLISEKNRKKGQFLLSSQKGNKISVNWAQQANGFTKIQLVRHKDHPVAANKVLIRINRQFQDKKLPSALNSIRFAFWLDPNNSNVKFEYLKVMASLLLYDEVFRYLKSRFTKLERVKACQKIHLETTFRKLWGQKKYLAKFKEICF